MKLIGRIPELEVLQRAFESQEAEFIAIYGRRRVGKTFLVHEFVEGRFAFKLTGVHHAQTAEQLVNFALALERTKGLREPDASVPATWQEAFRQLRDHLESEQQRRGERQVVFLDELPWLASPRSRFLSAFEHFWNDWGSRQPRLVLIVCGSSTSWILRNLIYARGGLHNRLTRRIHLKPFTLAETEEFFQSRYIDLDRRQILELYMVMGGVPHYLKEVEPGLSAAQNIDKICFSPTGLLRDEFDKLYASLFVHSDRYVEIVRGLAKRRMGLTRREIQSVAKSQSGGGLTETLSELAESGFVLVSQPFGKRERDRLYRLADEYSFFYLKWIEGHRTEGGDSWLQRQSGPAWKAASGYLFEGICLKHSGLIKRALGIEGVETSESCWIHRSDDPAEKGVQIDLLIDRKDACINLCEMKFYDRPFSLTKSYAAELRRKRDIFRAVTGTRKTVFVTMVTTYGIVQTKQSLGLVTSTVEMDALFG